MEGVKAWTDKKVYDKTEDPSKVELRSLSCKYIAPAKYKGSCVLSTLTNSIGSKWATTMKQLVTLIALPTREQPAHAQLQFLEDLSIKFEFEGPILIQFRDNKFLWYQPKKIDYLDADFITKMMDQDITLSEIYMNLSKKTGITNFMQVSNHLDDDNLLRYGDVHAANVKMNVDFGVPTIQDDSDQDP